MSADEDTPATAAPLGAAAGDDLADPQDRAGWFQDMDERCAEEGYFEPVGNRHWAWFHDDGPRLIVTFETLESILARPERLSFGHSVAAPQGWSHLCLISDGETWFRDDRVYRYFDRLVDDGFFEDFDRVLFFGAGHAAHAACAFSVTAPGAAVMAMRPRATLDPRMAGWDDRYTGLRRMDFTTRFGYAPDMVDAASAVWLIYDPTVKEDHMHAALFRGPQVHHLYARNVGDRVEDAMISMGFVPRLMTEACDGTLTPALYGRLWRRRMRSHNYLRELLAKAEGQQNQRRVWAICRVATTRVHSPRYRKLLAKLNPIFAPDADRAEELAED